MIRVLIAEDSITTRELLGAILRSDPEVQVVGEAKDGIEAVQMAKQLRPTLITMDIRMPKMDGFAATKQIMIEAPAPIVIVSAGFDSRDVEFSMHALRAGAVTVLAKPVGPGASNFEDECREFLSTIKSMAQVKVVRHWSPTPPKPHPPLYTPEHNGRRVRAVAIAASTGGPAALQILLGALPGNFRAPILVVQHISHGFVHGFVTWLNTACALQVKVAEEDEPLSPGVVYVAPDDHHLAVSRKARVLLSDQRPVEGFRPSGTVLFESVASVFGPSATAVVLTGMGQDGLSGLHSVHRSGGRVIAQDEESSVVFGMPGVAIDAGLAHHVLPLRSIANLLMEIVPS